MISAFIGIKKDQTQTFTEEGKRIPVTLISSAPNVVVMVNKSDLSDKTKIQLGIGKRRKTTLSNPIIGHLKKAGLDENPPRFLREVHISDLNNSGDLKPGTEINAEEIFSVGDLVQVTGISKGKGFAGGVKRHHFKGGPRTHGQSDRERAPGSIGQTTTPGRVYKGKRMAGRMGQDKTTVKNLKIVRIDSENKILSISGLVPGGRNSLLIIKKIS